MKVSLSEVSYKKKLFHHIPFFRCTCIYIYSIDIDIYAMLGHPAARACGRALLPPWPRREIMCRAQAKKLIGKPFD